jgi:alpha/beta superfamily hydrolase
VTVSRQVASILFPGPEGVVEGLWSDGLHPSPGRREPGEAAGSSQAGLPAVVICHPHPAHHGSMHSKVVHTIYRVLEAAGHPTLRFNFRGVGRSDGSYSGWYGEVDDLAAAAAHVRERTGQRTIWAAGFSFGSWIALTHSMHDPDVAQVIGLGLPVTANIDGRTFDFNDRLPWPLLLVQGDQDRYGSVADIAALRDRLALLGRVALRIVPRADHFFTGRIDALREGLESGLAALASGRT